MKVERITYALGASLKSPKHAYFPRSFPQNTVDRINYLFVNVYFASKTRMTRPLMWGDCSRGNPRSQCLQWKLELLF